jgi:hypothetical protein
VQGSVIGPHAFIVYIADLKARGITNTIIKYADDCTLLVPEMCDVTAEDELAHIKMWCIINKLLLNLIKTIEVVITRPNPRMDLIPDCFPDIERVQCAKVLGVYIDNKFSFSTHVDNLIKVCSQRFYLLQQMRKQGLSDESLKLVFNGIVLNKVQYALPMWAGYLSQEQIDRLDSIFKKAHRWHLTDTLHDTTELLGQMDIHLFTKCLNPDHCLNHLLEPPKSTSQMVLRPRGHSFSLPRFKYEVTKKSFIFRALYEFI